MEQPESRLENIQVESLNSDGHKDESKDGAQKPKRMNKTERKYMRYQEKLARYKAKKIEKKNAKKIQVQAESLTKTDAEDLGQAKQESEQAERPHNYDQFLSKRDLKQLVQKRLSDVYNVQEVQEKSLKICIDCSFSRIMSSKEQSRLAQQIGRCYAINKTYSSPVHFTLCNLDKDTPFYKELCRVNEGFERYIMKVVDKPLEEHFTDEERDQKLVYLSPDSADTLDDVDSNHIYIIGGLVDETVTKKVTLTKCDDLKIKTYSLPIEKYMKRKIDPKDGLFAKTYTYNKILAINQVFEILAKYFTEHDWPSALSCGVPKRKGFVLESDLTPTKLEENKEKD